MPKQMNPTKIFLLTLVSLVAISSTGCITIYNKKEEIGEREERLSVTFESEDSAQLFNTTASRKLKKPSPTDTSFVGIPFVTLYSKTTVLSENARFNDEIRRCDSNRDGIITDAEAKAYWLSAD